jgi:hypothetical protein
MFTEREIWAAARLLIAEHGEQALIRAGRRAEDLLALGNVYAHIGWVKVMATIEQLQSAAPGGLVH